MVCLHAGTTSSSPLPCLSRLADAWAWPAWAGPPARRRLPGWRVADDAGPARRNRRPPCRRERAGTWPAPGAGRRAGLVRREAGQRGPARPGRPLARSRGMPAPSPARVALARSGHLLFVVVAVAGEVAMPVDGDWNARRAAPLGKVRLNAAALADDRLDGA